MHRRHQNGEVGERQPQRRPVGGRASQLDPGQRVHRLGGDHAAEDPLRRRPVASLIGKLSAQQVDLAIWVEQLRAVQQRRRPGRIPAADMRAGRQQCRGVGDVTRLAHADGEPAADDDRKQCQQGPEHGADDTAGGRASVSVVIPVWNGRRWLDGCLESIAHQTRTVDEVIAVDNGSRDGSVAHLRAAYPQVRVLELGANTGFAHAVNAGLRAAAGDYVAVLNTDIVLERDWMARMADALGADPGAAAVACKMLELRRPGSHLRRRRRAPARRRLRAARPLLSR